MRTSLDRIQIINFNKNIRACHQSLSLIKLYFGTSKKTKMMITAPIFLLTADLVLHREIFQYLQQVYVPF